MCVFLNTLVGYTTDFPRQCSSQCKRNVYIEGVEAVDGGTLAGINYNYGVSCSGFLSNNLIA